jgi:uncharacterized damage-inducible protein DinB
MPRSDLQHALDLITSARRYTLRLLDSVPEAEWFRQPAEGISHLAWQVGHLAMAEYRLALERIRGRRPEDAALISEDFLTRFGRTSVPELDSNRNPPPGEIRGVFDRVHEQVLRELPQVTPATLAEPVARPHPIADTKLASLIWCAQHEMVHAGQIGLLRRLLGHPPLW